MAPDPSSSGTTLQRYVVIAGLLLVAVVAGFLSIALSDGSMFSNRTIAGVCAILSAVALTITSVVSFATRAARQDVGAVIIGGASGLGALIFFLHGARVLGT